MINQIVAQIFHESKLHTFASSKRPNRFSKFPKSLRTQYRPCSYLQLIKIELKMRPICFFTSYNQKAHTGL